MKALKIIGIVLLSIVGVIVIIVAGTFGYVYLKKAVYCENREMIEKCGLRQLRQDAQECNAFVNECQSYFATKAPKLPPEESAARKEGRRIQREYLEQGLREMEKSERSMREIFRQHGINRD